MLYKNRYLICLIDRKTDYIAGIFDNCEQFRKVVNNENAPFILNYAFLNPKHIFRKKFKIEFIDCRTITNDVFEDEDRDFIKFLNENNKLTNKERCERLNISERTFYRKQNQFRNKNFEKGLIFSWLFKKFNIKYLTKRN